MIKCTDQYLCRFQNKALSVVFSLHINTAYILFGSWHRPVLSHTSGEYYSLSHYYTLCRWAMWTSQMLSHNFLCNCTGQGRCQKPFSACWIALTSCEWTLSCWHDTSPSWCDNIAILLQKSPDAIGQCLTVIYEWNSHVKGDYFTIISILSCYNQ